MSSDQLNNGALDWGSYTDPAALDEEKKLILHTAWHLAATLDDFGDDPGWIRANVAGTDALLTRDDQGSVRAFVNRCVHRGCRLADASSKGKRIRCPYHAWVYSLDGKATAGPHVDTGELKLEELACHTYGPFIFVRTGGELPFAEWFHEVAQSLNSFGVDPKNLVKGRSSESHLRANWKIVVENYLECYHCTIAHRDFVARVDTRPDHYLQEAFDWTFVQTPLTVKGLSGGELPGCFYYLWPATVAYVLPGKPNLTLGSISPTSPNQTYRHYESYFSPDWTNEEIQEILAWDDTVGEEDTALVEGVQLGIEAGGDLTKRPVVLTEREQLVAEFQRRLANILSSPTHDGS